MATVYLNEFLTTGKFGSIILGDQYETVIQSLGPPEGQMKVSKLARAIHYGYYEFYFTDDQLTNIQNDQFNPEYPEMMKFTNDQLVIEPGLFTAAKTKTLAILKEELESAKIIFTQIPYYGRTAIRTQHGIIIDFNDEYIDDQKESLTKHRNLGNHTLIGFRYTLSESH